MNYSKKYQSKNSSASFYSNPWVQLRLVDLAMGKGDVKSVSETKEDGTQDNELREPTEFQNTKAIELNAVANYEPKKFADNYFKNVDGYSFEKLKEFMGSDGSTSQNMKLEDRLEAIIYLNKNLSSQEIWDQISKDPTQLNGYNIDNKDLDSEKQVLSKFTRTPATLQNVTIEEADISNLNSLNIEYKLSKNFLIRKKKRKAKKALAEKQATEFLRESANKLQVTIDEVRESKNELESKVLSLLTKVNLNLSDEALKKENLINLNISEVKANAESAKKEILQNYNNSIAVINKNTWTQKEKLKGYLTNALNKSAHSFNDQQTDIETIYEEFNGNIETLSSDFSKTIRYKGRKRFESHQKNGLFTSLVPERKAKASVHVSQIAETKLAALGNMATEDITSDQEFETTVSELAGTVISSKLNVIYREALSFLDAKSAAEKDAAKILMQNYFNQIDKITLEIIQNLSNTLDAYYIQLDEFGKSQETVINSFYVQAVNKLPESTNEFIESAKIRLEKFTEDQNGLKTPRNKKLTKSIEAAKNDLNPLFLQASEALGIQHQQNLARLGEFERLIFAEFAFLTDENTLAIHTYIKDGQENFDNIKAESINTQLALQENHSISIIKAVGDSKKQMDDELAEYFRKNQRQLSTIKSDLEARLKSFKEKAYKIINDLDSEMNAAELQVTKDYYSGKLKRTINVENYEKARDRLIGTQDAYLLYKELQGIKRRGIYGSVIDRKKEALTALLKRHGFKGGIEEYKQTLESFERGFRLSATAYALDLVDIYDKQLDKALKDFNNPLNMKNLFGRMTAYRNIVREMVPHVDYVNEMFRTTQKGEPSPIESTPKRVRTKEENRQYEKSAKRIKELEPLARKQLTFLYDDYPIFNDLAFPFKDQLDKKALGEAKSWQELQKVLIDYVYKRKNDVKNSKKQLIEDEGTEEVYTLDKLMPVAFQHLALNPKTFPGSIIQDAMDSKQQREFIWNIILAIITIALAILSGPLGAAVGMTALGASAAAFGALALGVYSAYETIDNYESQSAYATLGLSSEPSFIWVILAVVGVGLDIGPLFKSIKTISSLKQAVVSLDEIGDLAKFKNTLSYLEKTKQLDAKMSRAILNAAEARKGYYAAVKDFRKISKTLNTGVNPEMLGPLTRMAYHKIREGVASFDQFLILVKRSWNKKSLTPEELKVVKDAWEKGKEGVANGVTKYADEVDEVQKSTKLAGSSLEVVQGAGSFANQIDNTLSKLTGKAKYALDNTGEYKIVGGHHPMAKKAFEGDLVYDYKKAFSVKTSALDDAWKTANNGIPQNIHAKITGQQNRLYSAWKQTNPNAKLTIDVMADIEIQSMKNVGIPENIATGWVVKALEDLKAQGVTEIKNIPWNGTN